ncbi:pyruvate dehydrogenase complex dihydrolipoamide acetyltransferase [Cytophagaceae bacterium DM2B3-1]|uniref:Acetyltransferase component of pyruvate dehydrogenase complex n=1 Tax=Xanthocytophaga flava TaxID=3048013 RepID=A0ABT7CHT9_9BACT|nr:pyruvate dehydrogenase complex dihydrolipoamide acetyltransferase [Xanthocytophaga flavus]MDJ1493307.1 pyruvate dehydrogenase complex dihydrolipoamide acetyltransferase [Xanthocytophaga flavus]
MAEAIRMPKMSDTMTEGVIAGWLKKVGDTVKTGDVLAEVETDKATMELESYNEGTILYITDQKNVPIDGIIAVVGKPGEDFKALLDGKTGGSVATPPPAAEPKAEESKPAPTPVAATPAANVKATLVPMPQMTDTMTEGTIVKWHKQVGDTVKSGDLLAEIETDKATMDFESPEAGTLLYIGAKEGDAVAAKAPLVIIGEKGADYQALLGGGATTTASTPQAATTSNNTASATEPAKQPTTSVSDSDERVKISPLAKKIAEEKGVNIQQVKGSGENGRIVKRDVETFTPSAQPTSTPSTTPASQPAAEKAPAKAPVVTGQESYEDVPVSQMRKVIARRLAESMYSAPHFYLTIEVNMDKATTAREAMNQYSPVKLSFNDIVIKATAMALRQHAAINASWLGDKIRYNHHVSIGMAVAVPDGLLVPVIKNADIKSLSQISADAKELGGKAKDKKLQPQEMEGSTFSISNLGMFGIEEFTAIINPPNSCILAVGGIKQTPVVVNGEIKVSGIMKLTLSCDHRVVDGASGAAFLQTLKGLLEDPMRMLV